MRSKLNLLVLLLLGYLTVVPLLTALPTSPSVVLPGDVFSQTASVTVANTTTETSVIGAGVGTITVSPSFFSVGSTTKFTLVGVMSTLASSPGTLRIRFKIGTVVVADTAAQTLTVSQTNRQFRATAYITCRTSGVSGTMFTQGWTQVPTGALTTANWPMVNTTTQTVDTTVNQTFAATVQYSTANASNSITVTHLHIRKEA